MKKAIGIFLVSLLMIGVGWSQDLLIDDFNDGDMTNEVGGTNTDAATTGSSMGHLFVQQGAGDLLIVGSFYLNIQGSYPGSDWVMLMLGFPSPTDITGYSHLNYSYKPNTTSRMCIMMIDDVGGESAYWIDTLTPDEWFDDSLPISSLGSWPLAHVPEADMTRIVGIGIGISSAEGASETGDFRIDDVSLSPPVAIDSEFEWGGLKNLFRKE